MALENLFRDTLEFERMRKSGEIADPYNHPIRVHARAVWQRISEEVGERPSKQALESELQKEYDSLYAALVQQADEMSSDAESGRALTTQINFMMSTYRGAINTEQFKSDRARAAELSGGRRDAQRPPKRQRSEWKEELDEDAPAESSSASKSAELRAARIAKKSEAPSATLSAELEVEEGIVAKTNKKNKDSKEIVEAITKAPGLVKGDKSKAPRAKRNAQLAPPPAGFYSREQAAKILNNNGGWIRWLWKNNFLKGKETPEHGLILTKDSVDERAKSVRIVGTRFVSLKDKGLLKDKAPKAPKAKKEPKAPKAKKEPKAPKAPKVAADVSADPLP